MSKLSIRLCLKQLDQTLTRLSSPGADVKQLRTKLSVVVTEKADRLTQVVIRHHADDHLAREISVLVRAPSQGDKAV
jgi:hypothetical protein